MIIINKLCSFRTPAPVVQALFVAKKLSSSFGSWLGGSDTHAGLRARRVDRKRHAEIVKLRRLRTKLQDHFHVLETIPKINANGLARV